MVVVGLIRSQNPEKPYCGIFGLIKVYVNRQASLLRADTAAVLHRWAGGPVGRQDGSPYPEFRANSRHHRVCRYHLPQIGRAVDLDAGEG